MIPKHLRQRGQGTIEYIGIAVIAAIIIAGIVATPLAPKMSAGIENVICNIFSHAPGGGQSTCGQIADDPLVCEVSRHKYERYADVTADVKAVEVNAKKGASVELVETNDGWEVIVTSDYGASGAKEIGTGGDGKKGSDNKDGDSGSESSDGNGDEGDGVEVGVDVEAEVKVEGEYSYGQSFQFESEEEAREFFDQAKQNVNSGDALNPFKSMAPFTDLGDPDIETHRVALNGQGNANFDYTMNLGGEDSQDSSSNNGKSGDSGTDSTGEDNTDDSEAEHIKILEELGAGADASVNIGVEGAYSINHKDGTKTYYVQVGGGLEGNANQEFLGTAGANANGSTLLAVTFDDETGEISNITSKTMYNADAGVNGGEDIINQSVITGSMDFDTPEERARAKEALQNLDNPFARFHNGKDANPETYSISDLFYDQAQVSKQERTTTAEEAEEDMGWFRSGTNWVSSGIGNGDVFSQGNSTTDTHTTSFSHFAPPDSTGKRNWEVVAECTGQ